jgi:hypothetical protein
MDQTITLQALIQSAALIVGIWGFIKVVTEIAKAINERHDKEQKWGEWEVNLQEERDKIYERYDTKLAEMEEKIDNNHADTEAKIQQTRSELYILTECMAAVLDGLKQLNCNGKVTEAKENLDAYLIKRAHE